MNQDTADESDSIKKARRLAAARALAAAGGLPVAASIPAALPPRKPSPFPENTGVNSVGDDGAALGLGLARRTYGGVNGDAHRTDGTRAEDQSAFVFKRNETIGYLDSASFAAASLDVAIPPENRGYRLLAKMGWRAGEGLGRRNSGIAAPIGLVAAEGTMGLGKAAEYDKANEDATRERRKLMVEREETDETRAASAAHAERDAARADALKRQNAEFFCSICDKQCVSSLNDHTATANCRSSFVRLLGCSSPPFALHTMSQHASTSAVNRYKNVSEMANHLSSYDHHHKKRFVEMKEAERARLGGDAAADAKRERERRREEKEMRRRMAAVVRGTTTTVAMAAEVHVQPPPQPPPARSVPTAGATPSPPPTSGSAFVAQASGPPGGAFGAVSFSLGTGRAPAPTSNGDARPAFGGFRAGNGRGGRGPTSS